MLLTIDVEDYFQVSAFEDSVKRSDWDSIEPRVEQNTQKALALFDRHHAKATFFMLGWVAERFPQLVKDVVDAGHELASHGYEHRRATQQSREEFRDDIRRTKKLLEDISGVEIKGYRAPSYSIGKANIWAHEEIEEAGYQYSSSVYPVKHDLYGFPEAPRHMFRCREKLYEIPITTLQIGKTNVPIGGGGFFRFYPYAFSKWAFESFNSKEEKPAIFYFHPWELDPDQPRNTPLKLKSLFRHYLNLKHMEGRLSQLLKDFQWDRMDRVFLPDTA